MRRILVLALAVIAPALAAPSAPEVVFATRGGMISLRDTLTLYPDGKVTFARRQGTHQLQLSRAEQAALESQLDAAARVTVDPPQPSPPDGMSFSLAITRQGQTVKLSWGDPGPTPPALKPLLDCLTGLERRLGKN